MQFRLQARLVVLQLVQGQGQEGLDAGTQDPVGALESDVDLFLGADHMARVVHAPVNAQDRAEIGWARFARGTGADGDHDVRCHRQVVPGLAVVALGRDTLIGQQGQRSFVQLAGGLAAGADRMPAGGREVVEHRFADERAAGVASAEEKYVHVRSLGEE